MCVSTMQTLGIAQNVTGLFQVLTQIATVRLVIFWLQILVPNAMDLSYATSVVKSRVRRNCREKTIEKHKSSRGGGHLEVPRYPGGTGVSQSGPPLGLYPTILSPNSTWILPTPLGFYLADLPAVFF